MKLLFLLPEYHITGGVYVVMKSAEILATRGRHDVTVAVPSVDRAKSNTWLRLEDAVPVRSHAEAVRGTYDIVFATWWQTLLESIRFEARVHALFMQAWEGAFYTWGDPEQEKYEFLLDAHAFPSLGTARWMLNYASRPAYYFLAGLDRCVFQPTPPAISRQEGHVRFLVEGNVLDARKNVRRTLDLLERRGVEYIWVGSEVSSAEVGPHCVGVFSNVPLNRMAAVYSSADVLIKLSNSEGMFAPPLEMFSCGGTAICWDVQGAEEFMVHGYNSLLCPMNNFSSASAAVEALRDDRDVVGRLKAGAARTAEGWPSWPDVAGNLLRCVEAIARHENQGQFLRVLEDYAKRVGQVR
jgi:O-antigen biosynthesis protein